MIIVLPNDFYSLCDFDKDAAQDIDIQLNLYWVDNYGALPVVIMKTYDSGGGKYQKEIFVEKFNFANGNCISQYKGSEELFYLGDGKGC